jgi:hypothetical protein
MGTDFRLSLDPASPQPNTPYGVGNEILGVLPDVLVTRKKVTLVSFNPT